MTNKRARPTNQQRKRTFSSSPHHEADLLDYADAAAYLGISKGTLQNWVSSGSYGIPHIPVGGRIKFRRASLDRWLLSRERGGNEFVGVAASEGLEAR